MAVCKYPLTHASATKKPCAALCRLGGAALVPAWRCRPCARPLCWTAVFISLKNSIADSPILRNRLLHGLGWPCVAIDQGHKWAQARTRWHKSAKGGTRAHKVAQERTRGGTSARSKRCQGAASQPPGRSPRGTRAGTRPKVKQSPSIRRGPLTPPNGTRWHKPAQDGTRRHKMAQAGTRAHKMAQDGTSKHKMAQVDTK